MAQGGGVTLISVVIPTYNMADYLGEAIDSVLLQTFRDFEVVVVDDGSTDATPKLLSRYAGQIRVLRQPNRGGAAALNEGIRSARGEWIAWLSADDAWEAQKLERQVDLVRRQPDVGLVYTDYVYIDAHGSSLSREHFPLPSTPRGVLLKLIRRCFVNGSSTLIRKDVFDRIGFYDEGDRLTPDWDFFLRAATVVKFSHVPEPLVRYRIHAAQTSAKRASMERASRRTMSRNLRRMGPLLGSWAAILLLQKQVRSFPAFVRRSVGHSRTIRGQTLDLVEWLTLLVNPESSWAPQAEP